MANTNEDESFVRWQGITISQLGYAVNLILGLAVAALGFVITLLLNKEFIPVSWMKCTFSVALLSLLASIGIGIWCVVNRLRDFRATKEVARKREKGATDSELQPLRDLSGRLGSKTWWLFWWQIGMFGAGIALTVVGIAGVLSGKLL